MGCAFYLLLKQWLLFCLGSQTHLWGAGNLRGKELREQEGSRLFLLLGTRRGRSVPWGSLLPQLLWHTFSHTVIFWVGFPYHALQNEHHLPSLKHNVRSHESCH